jgi:hypothetical protein
MYSAAVWPRSQPRMRPSVTRRVMPPRVPRSPLCHQGRMPQPTSGTGPGPCWTAFDCAKVLRVTRIAAICLTLVLGVLSGCGGDTKAGGAKPASQDQAARTALKSVKPISSARVDAQLRITLDNAPASVGDSLELSLKGPLRSNGPGKLPSLDWKLAFDGLNQHFSSRIVSTGDNLFVRLGGADFEVGEDAIADINRQSAQAKGGDGLAAIGIDPLAALKDVRRRGSATVAGATTTHYVGTVEMDKLLDQVQRFLRTVPRQATAGQAPPPLELTPERRRQVAQTFAAPQVEVDVGNDDTIRQPRADAGTAPPGRPDLRCAAGRGRRRKRRHDPPARALHPLHHVHGEPAGGRRDHGRDDRVPAAVHRRWQRGHHRAREGRAADLGVLRRAAARAVQVGTGGSLSAAG